jgi:pimeloyl-ACP methyl ester carboxylesterase
VSEGFARSALGQYLLESFMDATEGLDGEAIGRVFEALGVADVQPKLATFRTPSLVINGEFDGALPRGTETAKMIPGARHVILKGAGHACNLEDPRAFDQAVIDFLCDHHLMPGRPA